MKQIIIICSMMLVVASASAQRYWDGSRPDHRLTFGVRAGFNLSKFFEDDIEWRYRFGYQAGVEVDVNFVRSLSINTGLYYIQKGYKMEIELGPSYIQKFEFKPVYLEIPLALSYRIRLSDSSQFQLNAGGYFAYGIKSSDESFFNGDFKKEDIGMTLGAAVTYSHYYFGANYQHSLTNVGSSDIKSYHSNIVVSLGYNF